MPIKLSDIYFGERDALHEFLKQDRQNIEILDQSFVVPPRVKMAELESGARFLVLGPKGSGKTTILWFLKRTAPRARSKMILFKSEIRKEDRDKLDKMVDLIVIRDQKNSPFHLDYRTVWEWYLIKTIFTLIKPDDIFEGQEVYRDIKILLGIKDQKLNTIFDNFFINTIRGKVKLALGYGALSSEIGAEIEARRHDDTIDLLELIRTIQNYFYSIKLHPESSVRLYVDELEFFMSHDGDGDRDRRLVRDLIFSVDSINGLAASANLNIVIVASLRSEIFNSISSNSQEVQKIVDAYGVKLNWFHDDVENHSVLKIFEKKIRSSEILQSETPSENVWDQYFPAAIEGKSIRNYLLDIGLHRPRGVILRLKAALEASNSEYKFTEASFTASREIYGHLMLQEFNDEISAAYDETTRENILSLFRGFNFSFMVHDIEHRRHELSEKKPKNRSALNKINVNTVIRFLFNIGMIGNQFDIIQNSKSRITRENWSFRGGVDPLLDKRFVIHQSVRKILRTI